MSIDKDAQIVRLFRAVADENRFKIFTLLLGNDLCVGALAHILNISKPAVSQHLKILRNAGLIRGEKRGYWTHYVVEKETLLYAARYLQKLSELQSDTAGSGAFICLREKGSKTNTERRVLQMCKSSCEQPDKLKTKPSECTPEQIKECHGESKIHLCEYSCEQPDKLKTKPSECTPEQIKECHGENNENP
jgi:ArsR family transcriptional regulator, arsenate/arsenite/antimonite-responsive transcriptional repressor